MSGRRRCVLRAATLLSLLASAAIAGAATRSVVGTPGLSVPDHAPSLSKSNMHGIYHARAVPSAFQAGREGGGQGKVEVAVARARLELGALGPLVPGVDDDSPFVGKGALVQGVLIVYGSSERHGITATPSRAATQS